MTEQIKNILFSYRRRVHCTLQLTIIIRVPPQKNKIVVGITLIFYICLASGCWWLGGGYQCWHQRGGQPSIDLPSSE